MKQPLKFNLAFTKQVSEFCYDFEELNIINFFYGNFIQMKIRVVMRQMRAITRILNKYLTMMMMIFLKLVEAQFRAWGFQEFFIVYYSVCFNVQ